MGTRSEIARFFASCGVTLSTLCLLAATSPTAGAATTIDAMEPTNPNCKPTTSGTACIWEDESANYFAYDQYCDGSGCETCVQSPSEVCSQTGWDETN